ncbi:TIGR02587 family membrane protein [Calothrix sp. UHCC 0171]|uniref:TIGR02587 family membrane protein n=1 Tax=Calothrix sp. UHCC 0171 TaxID=3110245 RepID=UPI002B21231D|nr:TIGR02587 family membrane protein [Calothrix sp. UHCC 0171]MEA5574239.1 TIGR02587 family membrane protein [Calothrix sp. UHCC 0171]
MKVKNKRQSHIKSNIWVSEINDIIRGICGGFLFGIPLLYTMEVWWIGSVVKPQMNIIAIILTFVVVYLLNRTEGFRKYRKDNRPYEAIINTIEAMAIGIICSVFMLILLREITPDNFLKESVGKIIFESVPFTFGVALANQFLGESNGDSDSRNNQQNQHKNHQKSNHKLISKSTAKSEQLYATLSDIGATLIGATVIAFNIAPTDEISMLAAAFSPIWLLLIILVSLLISYSIVFQAGFSNQQKRQQQEGIFQRPSSETIMAYLVSLIASAFMLWFFQKLTFNDPWTMWLDHTLLLGLPASIGGAAGRLAI